MISTTQSLHKLSWFSLVHLKMKMIPREYGCAGILEPH